uniref:Uncharacterized protein n=1 Tax=Anguilla anguilla TaxID=7936 RepID=A0A0E9ULS5_ANGAN
MFLTLCSVTGEFSSSEEVMKSISLLSRVRDSTG